MAQIGINSEFKLTGDKAVLSALDSVIARATATDKALTAVVARITTMSKAFTSSTASMARAITTNNSLAQSVARTATAMSKQQSALDTQAVAAARAQSAFTRLQTSQTNLATSQERLAAASARTNTAQDRAALAANRLAIAQERTIQAQARSAVSANELASAQARLQTAQVNLATAATRGSTAQTQLQTALSNQASASSRAQSAAIGVATAQQRLNSTTTGAQRSTVQLSTAQNQNATSATRSQLASVQLAAAQDRLDKQLARSKNSYDTLGTAFKAYLALFSFNTFKEYADAAVNINNRLVLVTGSQEQANAVFDRFTNIAIKTGAQVNTLSQFYTSTSNALKSLKITGIDATQVTESLAGIIKIAGGESSSLGAAIVQTGQAMSGNFATSAQEINSVIEQFPQLAHYVAEGMNEIAGSSTYTSSSLKKMAQNGELDTLRFVNAIGAAQTKIAADGAKMQQTISAGFSAVSSAFTSFIYYANQGYGITGLFTNALVLLANNFNIVASAAIALGSVFLAIRLATFAQTLWIMATVQLPALITSFTAATVAAWGFTTALLANPITWVVVGILGLLGAIGAMISYLATGGVSWAGFGTGVLIVLDTIIGAVVGAGGAIWETFKLVGNSLNNFFGGIFNNIVGYIETAVNNVIKAINVMIDAYNAVAAIAGFPTAGHIGSVSLGRATITAVDTGAISQAMLDGMKTTYASDLAGAIAGAFSGVGSGATTNTFTPGTGGAGAGGKALTIPDAQTSTGGVASLTPYLSQIADNTTDLPASIADSVAPATATALGDTLSTTNWTTAFAYQSGSTSTGGGSGGVSSLDSLNTSLSSTTDAITNLTNATQNLVQSFTATQDGYGKGSGSFVSNGAGGALWVTGGQNSTTAQTAAVQPKIDDLAVSTATGKLKDSEWSISNWGFAPMGNGGAIQDAEFFQANVIKAIQTNDTTSGKALKNQYLNMIKSNSPNLWYYQTAIEPVESQLMAFRNGGSFDVGGFGGYDSQTVAFKASPNERVSIETPAQRKASQNGNEGKSNTFQVAFNITTENADSFKRSEKQLKIQMRNWLAEVSE